MVYYCAELLREREDGDVGYGWLSTDWKSLDCCVGFSLLYILRLEWSTDVFGFSETYALYMYDSAAQKTSMPQPGKLGLFNTFTFAMYTPRGNIKLDGVSSFSFALSFPLQSSVRGVFSGNISSNVEWVDYI